MESNSKGNEEKFSYISIPIADCRLNTLKGNAQGKEINTTISASHEENYINVNMVNQLLIQESNIGERTHIFGKKEYEINYLQVIIDHYECTSQFCVVTMFNPKIDIILGQPWLKELGTFMLNL